MRTDATFATTVVPCSVTSTVCVGRKNSIPVLVNCDTSNIEPDTAHRMHSGTISPAVTARCNHGLLLSMI